MSLTHGASWIELHLLYSLSSFESEVSDIKESGIVIYQSTYRQHHIAGNLRKVTFLERSVQMYSVKMFEGLISWVYLNKVIYLPSNGAKNLEVKISKCLLGIRKFNTNFPLYGSINYPIQ